MNKFFLMLPLVTVCFFSFSAMAQEEAGVEGQQAELGFLEGLEETRQNMDRADLYGNVADPTDLIAPMRRRAMEIDGVQEPPSDISLFFTPREVGLIAEAREGFVARLATEEEIERSQDPTQRRRGPREVSLGGVLYVSNDEWAVWINGVKITPGRIPPEITDIRVGKDFVKLKWYDEYTNQIFPIKLLPQQRFNIDTRIFLPG